jgi:hypothetical protein
MTLLSDVTLLPAFLKAANTQIYNSDILKTFFLFPLYVHPLTAVQQLLAYILPRRPFMRQLVLRVTFFCSATKVECSGKRLMVCWKMWGFWNSLLYKIVFQNPQMFSNFSRAIDFNNIPVLTEEILLKHVIFQFFSVFLGPFQSCTVMFSPFKSDPVQSFSVLCSRV